MLKSNTIIIPAIFILLFFICIVDNNFAAETNVPQHGPIVINELIYGDGDPEVYNYGSESYHFSIRTDRPYHAILWYVQDKENIIISNGISIGDGETTNTSYGFSNLSGSIGGVTYKITAIAIPPEPGNFLSDIKSLDFKVYSPELRKLVPNHTDTYGHVCIRKLSYDKDAIVTWDDWFNQAVHWKGIAHSEGFFYLSNRSDDETYFFTWETRLEILGYGRDEKQHNREDLTTLEPGETFDVNYSAFFKSLSLPVDRTTAPRGKWHTMLATYTLNVDTGHVNEEDSCQVNAKYKFFHGDEPDE